MKRLNLEGKTFGRLKVCAFNKTYQGKTMWTCKCSCGKTVVCNGSLLKSGAVKSCGCLRVDMGKEKNLIHGLSSERPYYVWKDIIRRCYDVSRPEYKNYGGRGITVCDEWKNNVVSFETWARKSGFKTGLTIDRIDNDGSYMPENCQWVTQRENANNTRRNKWAEINGIKKTVSQWSMVSGINDNTLRGRMAKGDTGEKILRPVDNRFCHKRVEVLITDMHDGHEPMTKGDGGNDAR